PGSGVVGGAGTAADPYRIEGWSIVHAGHVGVEIRNTTAHVVVRDLYLPGDDGLPFGSVRCAQPGSVCDGSVAIQLRNASNVRVERVRALHDTIGVLVDGGSSRVAVDRMDLRSTIHPRVEPATTRSSVGILVRDASDVAFSNVTIANRNLPVVLARSADVSLRDSTVQGAGTSLPAVQLFDTERVSLVGNSFVGASVAAVGMNRDLRLALNTAQASRHLFAPLSDGFVDGLDACGNVVTGATSVSGALHLTHVRNASVRGNVLRDGVAGIVIDNSENLTLTSNEISGSSEYALFADAPGVSASGNAISGNGLGSFFYQSADLRGNWWGDASGPSGLGSGSGDLVDAAPGVAVDVSGWLSSPPSLSVDCGVPARAAAPPVVSSVGAQASVGLEASVRVRVPGASPVALVVDDAVVVAPPPVVLP
ncbi:MAG TPA: NosD domain-containing protein, partial [Candidatus Thermoplasmatota archaeon]|nr:NosD domain-containing protein [Candidatus Thermoplasmatota archaeon]